MSEIRSQATPARDELAEKWRADLIKAQGDELTIELGRRGASELLELLSPPKPRTVNSAAELHALAVESVVRNRDGWIGEISIVSGKPVIFWIGNECEDELKDIALPATVLFTPGDAG